MATMNHLQSLNATVLRDCTCFGYSNHELIYIELDVVGRDGTLAIGILNL